jgi:transposase
MGTEPPIPKELWDSIPAAAQAALLLVFQRYEQRLAALEQQVADLQQRLNQNSTNSSKPPSADPPAVKRAPPKTPSGKKRGGQPGHLRCQRPLLEPTVVHELKPTQCRRCAAPLTGADPQPLPHQVVDLPRIQPIVTEYRCHRLVCACCGTSTCADLPPEAAARTGPRLQGVLSFFSGVCRLSKRLVQTVANDLLNVPLSLGEVCAQERRTEAALAQPVAAARAYVQQAAAVHVDETSWRENKKRGWLWTAVTALVSVFLIRPSRAAAVACELLGSSTGIVHSDRYSAYHQIPLARRQVCWAHLRRDFQAMIDRGNRGTECGERLLILADDLFLWWHSLIDGYSDRATFEKQAWRIRRHVRAALRDGMQSGCARTAGTCAEILKVERALWTFVRGTGIEPTNNAAERALRHAVQWRKTSYGTDSAAGSRFVESLLTVAASCKQQGRNLLEYLTACCQALTNGTKPPSLIPAATTR